MNGDVVLTFGCFMFIHWHVAGPVIYRLAHIPCPNQSHTYVLGAGLPWCAVPQLGLMFRLDSLTVVAHWPAGEIIGACVLAVAWVGLSAPLM